jgi:hypothetical protein
MRVLVLEEQNGAARVRERCEVFEIEELFRLIYTCPQCETEFILNAEGSSCRPQCGTSGANTCGNTAQN